MNSELPFRIAFAALFVTFMALRVYYHRKAGTLGESIASEAENPLIPMLRRGLGVPWLIGIVLYLVYPTWVMWAAIPLPETLRWVGVVLGALTLPMFLWIHQALAANFSTTTHIQAHHTLVTSGPYQWVRHPMYPALWVFSLATLLISANWLVGLIPVVMVTLIMLTRPAREEQQLIDTFGDDYRAYMQRTGRFFPRIAR